LTAPILAKEGYLGKERRSINKRGEKVIRETWKLWSNYLKVGVEGESDLKKGIPRKEEMPEVLIRQPIKEIFEEFGGGLCRGIKRSRGRIKN